MKKSKPLIFNPAEEPKESLIANFIIRLDVFEKIIKIIKTSAIDVAPQHFLIIGQRGMGKTTLLLRIKYEVQDIPELSKNHLAIRFSEEQYQISNLINLWEETAIALSNTSKQYKDLYSEMLHNEDKKDYERICFDLLSNSLKQTGKRLVLLIDNIGKLFERFSDQESYRLREILMTSPYILLIGGSSEVLEHTHRYDKPFFEFFYQLKLEPLTTAETLQLMTNLASNYHVENKIALIIKNNPERIEALRRITGGVPRTMVLLFEILADSDNGAAFEDLEELTDRVTALYMHRMESLKPQQQKIIDTLARAWEPISSKELLIQSRLYREGLQSNQISSQLKQLEENQLIETITYKGKKRYYRIRERFFNIWYLMRYGRKNSKEQVLWLVRFLETWCTKQEIDEIAKEQIRCINQGSYYERAAYYKAIAIHSIDGVNSDTKKQLLEKIEAFLRKNSKEEWADIIHLLNEDIPKDSYTIKALQAYSKNEVILAEKLFLKALENKEKSILTIIAMFYELALGDNKKAEKYLQLAIEEGNIKAMNNLAILYIKNKEFDKAEKILSKAIDAGDITAIFNLGHFYETQNNEKTAIEYYLKAISHGHTGAMINLGNVYREKKDLKKAEKYYLLAAEHNSPTAMNNLATLYRHMKKDYTKAEKLYVEAIKIDEKNPALLYNITFNYFDLNQPINALKYAEKFLNLENSYDHLDRVMQLLDLLLVKKQYNFLLKKYQQENSSLKKYMLPYYYALAYFIKDQLPGEYEKAGDEIKETVDEIIKSTKNEIGIDKIQTKKNN